jgi:very-short-patch-repair endonuclease
VILSSERYIPHDYEHLRNLKLVKFAKNLRQSQTDCEIKLWYHLRGRRFENLKIRRQYPIGSYIADFICVEKMLLIELDGGQHADSKKDVVRDNYLKSKGYITLRFWNSDVIENINGVLETIRTSINNPHPNLLPERDKELQEC